MGAVLDTDASGVGVGPVFDVNVSDVRAVLDTDACNVGVRAMLDTDASDMPHTINLPHSK